MTDRGPALQVDGGRQLRASLKRAGLDVTDLKAAHRAVAEDVARESRPEAPVGDGGPHPGQLRDTTRASGTQSAAIVRAGSAAVPYAGPIHWGWPNRHIDAQPWLADTAERREPVWSDTYLHAIETIIDTIEGVPTP